MAINKFRFDDRRHYVKYLVLTLLIFLGALRFVRLDWDPPVFYYGYTQSDLTDPYHLTFAARNAILFDTWNLFDFHRWDVFKYSLISGMAYLVFLIFGVSRITANIAALILTLGGLFLFLLGLRRFRPDREIAIIALLLLSNNFLFFLGRLPFLETGLIFLSGLTFFIFIKFYDRLWGQLLCGFVIAMAALAGKLFGLLLLGPVILSFLYIYRGKMIRPVLLTIAGTFLGMVLYVLVFYGGSLTIMANYYAEQSTGMYGSPMGFISPLEFIASLISYGSDMGLSELSLSPILLGFFGLSIFLLTAPLEKPFKKEYLPIIFAAAWLICGVTGLSPFNYRPLRYALPLFIPLLTLGGYAINRFFDRTIEISLHRSWITLLLIFFGAWTTITQVYILFVPYSKEVIAAKAAIPITIIPAFITTALIFIWVRRKRPISRKIYGIIVLVLVLFTAGEQGSYLYRGLTFPNYYLKDANRQLAELVDANAVITGPFAPALTIDNKLKGVIYVFGLSNVEKDLFDKFPITHVVTDPGNWEIAVKDFPLLAGAMLVTRIKIRGTDINLYRLPGAKVPMTDLEMGAQWAARSRADSAMKYTERFYQAHPDNKCCIWALAYCYSANHQIEKLEKFLKEVPARFPDDFISYLLCRDGYQQLFKMTGNPEFKTLSEQADIKAKVINPALTQRER